MSTLGKEHETIFAYDRRYFIVSAAGRNDVERCVMVSDDNVSCHITPGLWRILSYSIVKRVVAWCKDIYILPNIICPF